MPTLLVIEPNLGARGHWQTHVNNIAREAHRLGWHTRCLGGPAASATSTNHLDVVPCIEHAPPGWLAPGVGTAPDLDAIAASNARLASELAALPHDRTDDVRAVLVPAATTWNVLGIARWLAQRRPQAQAAFQLLVPDFLDLAGGDLPDERVAIYAEATRTLLDAGAPPPLLWTEALVLTDRLAPHLDARVRIERAPHLRSFDRALALRRRRRRGRGDPVTIGKLGRLHEDTGLFQLPFVVREVLARQGDGVRFVIHAAPYAFQEGLESHRDAMALVHALDDLPQVTVIREALDDAAWDAVLADLDVLFLPYDARFRYQSSGPFREALALGIVTVVPRGSSLDADARELGSGSARFEMGDVGDMVTGIERAVGSRTRARKSRWAARRWRRAQDAGRAFGKLLDAAARQ